MKVNLNLPQTEIEFRNALIDAAEVGAEKALIGIGEKSLLVKRTEAERVNGKHTIKTLLDAELIRPHKEGSRNETVYFDRLQLTIALKTYYRITNYQPQQK